MDLIETNPFTRAKGAHMQHRAVFQQMCVCVFSLHATRTCKEEPNPQKKPLTFYDILLKFESYSRACILYTSQLLRYQGTNPIRTHNDSPIYIKRKPNKSLYTDPTCTMRTTTNDSLPLHSHSNSIQRFCVTITALVLRERFTGSQLSTLLRDVHLSHR